MSWVSVQDRLPEECDGDADGKVLVWHEIQGVMLCRWEKVRENRFHSHWMVIEGFAKGKWVDAHEKKPTKADADVFQCILAMNRHDEHHVTGWHQVHDGGTITQWQRLPDAPET